MDVDKISFTGSTETGRKVMEAAAKSNLKTVSLELGGKSPLIIFDDADVDMAVALARVASFFNKASKLLRARSIQKHDHSSGGILREKSASPAREFTFKKAFTMSSWRRPQRLPRAGKQGTLLIPPCNKAHRSVAPSTQFQIFVDHGKFSPFLTVCLQIDERQFEKVLRYIELGKQEGATLLAGGKPCGEKGFYIEPTIFTDVKVKLMYICFLSPFYSCISCISLAGRHEDFPR